MRKYLLRWGYTPNWAQEQYEAAVQAWNATEKMQAARELSRIESIKRLVDLIRV